MFYIDRILPFYQVHVTTLGSRNRAFSLAPFDLKVQL